jgi:hypothetical protein
VDGVCNHDDWYYQNRVLNKNYKCGDFDPKVIELLNQLQDLEVKVVISSSWRDSADKPLMDLGLKLPIIGHTEHFYSDGWLCRGNEIEKWLYDNHIHEHIDDSYKYVIFDDDKDMLLKQVDNFVWVNSQHGLTQAHIDKAREIFS